MRLRVEVAPEAQEQLERLDRWWRQNRPAAPTLVVDELERLVGMIAETPEIGVPYAQGGLMNVRRLRLRRTPYLLYYHYVSGNDVARIVSAWSAMRKRRPSIKAP
jgi:plasmid stabilization system protein ParE